MEVIRAGHKAEDDADLEVVLQVFAAVDEYERHGQRQREEDLNIRDDTKSRLEEIVYTFGAVGWLLSRTTRPRTWDIAVLAPIPETLYVSGMFRTIKHLDSSKSPASGGTYFDGFR